MPGAQHNSLAARALAAAQTLARPFRAEELEPALKIRSFRERKRLQLALRDLERHGRLERDERPYYRLPPAAEKPLQLYEKIWRAVRVERQYGPFTLRQLATTAEASLWYAKEYCQFLVRDGWLGKIGGGRLRQLRDSLTPPINEAKAERLRKLRARRKER